MVLLAKDRNDRFQKLGSYCQKYTIRKLETSTQQNANRSVPFHVLYMQMKNWAKRTFSLADSDIVQSYQSITCSWNWNMHIWYGTQWTVLCYFLPLTSLLALFSHVTIASLTRFTYHRNKHFIIYDLRDKRSLCGHWHLTVCSIIKSSNVVVLSTSATDLIYLSSIFYMKRLLHINHNSEFSLFSSQKVTVASEFFIVISHSNIHF